MSNQINVNNSERFYTRTGLNIYTLELNTNLPLADPKQLVWTPLELQELNMTFLGSSGIVLGFTEPGMYSITVHLNFRIGSTNSEVVEINTIMPFVNKGIFTDFSPATVDTVLPKTGNTYQIESPLSYVGYFDYGEGVKIVCGKVSGSTVTVLSNGTELVVSKLY